MENDGVFEDLFRMPDGSWSLLTRHIVFLKEPTLQTMPEDDAVAWLITLRQSSRANDPPIGSGRVRNSVPDWVVPYEEHRSSGRTEWSGPPPLGQVIELKLEACSFRISLAKERNARPTRLASLRRAPAWRGPVRLA